MVYLCNGNDNGYSDDVLGWKEKMRTRILWYTGDIRVGDLVKRRIRGPIDNDLVEEYGEYGIVVSRQMVGNPIHPCVSVSWSKIPRPCSISESYLEVVCKKGNE